jgi:imidazolonepropionase-like amidohydrolase
MEAIISATRINAEIVGAQDDIGTLEPGKAADLIVVDGDPLADLSLLENGMETVLLVMKAGRILKDRLTAP